MLSVATWRLGVHFTLSARNYKSAPNSSLLASMFYNSASGLGIEGY